MRRTKILLFSLVFTLLFTFVPATYTFAASNKTQVKKTVTNFFKYAKKLSPKMGKYVWNSDGDDEDDQDVDPLLKFYSGQNKKYFKYKIKSIKVKGSTANVKVKVTYRSFKKATKAAYIDVAALMVKGDIDEDEMYKPLIKYIKKEAKKYKPKKVSKTITLKLKKKNKKWKIKSPGDAVLDSITCDLFSASEEVAKALP